MKALLSVLLLAATSLQPLRAADPDFTDRFAGRLGPGWSWIREQPDAWRVSERGLEIRLLPGNMWGPANNARNVLVRPLPDPSTNAVVVSVQVANQPAEQYEQVDLVWFYDESNMVKIGLELVDGTLSIVMGREEADRTRTIALIPFEAKTVQLRFRAQGTTLRGEYRIPARSDWLDAGVCVLPTNGAPKASLQCYQGPTTGERWALITDFTVTQAKP